MSFDEMQPPILACKVVDTKQWPLQHRLRHQNLLDEGNREAREITYPAPGSIQATCPDCLVGVWIGPRTQDAIAHFASAGIALETLCLMCAAVRIHEQEAEAAVVSLGNPYRPDLPEE